MAGAGEEASISSISSIPAVVLRKRRSSKSRRIVISEHNYLRLKELGHAGDSFNDVVSKLLRIYRAYQEQPQQRQSEEQQHNQGQEEGEVDDNDKERFLTSTDKIPFIPTSLSELFDEHDRQRLANLLDYRNRKNNYQ